MRTFIGGEVFWELKVPPPSNIYIYCNSVIEEEEKKSDLRHFRPKPDYRSDYNLWGGL